MKKGFIFLCAIVFGLCILQGCANSGASRQPNASGFPVGHDMHPDADHEKKQLEDKTHPLRGYSEKEPHSAV